MACRIQLAFVVDVAEAGRTLFGAQTMQTSSANTWRASEQNFRESARLIQLTVAELGDVLEQLTLSQPRANTCI